MELIQVANNGIDKNLENKKYRFLFPQVEGTQK